MTTTTNNATVPTGWVALGMLLTLSSFASGCTTSKVDDPASSGSHWLTCNADRDCNTQVAGSHCGNKGVCLDASGARVPKPKVDGGSGQSEAGGAGAGSSGK